ncbi:MAG: xanthan lyase [Bacteroidetes bacterium GWF2_42_66]|nr:MAG: xanthan lyase [Bacteroidetes bacterium GWA2_42_15]OFY01085.1 MAG: xanthan lyase [Bacteroidetes bacterium GWE2_42_39]OFY41928.1 MAG: xanthan lyase [Bacteroidetes bacterium GWF2_42_66]HBL77884.1 xanthan lyase [Prolixibacteraceae bacterium]HCR91360.1 xanthan lyase [Prolixibacteraceae bacterium]
MKNQFFKILIFVLSGTLLSCSERSTEYDVVVYGGTSAGIVAAVQAVKMGKSVIIIEPGTEQQLGGLTTGGLGATDIGNKMVIGGISREFYQNIKKYYEDQKNWKWQNREDYIEGRNKTGEDAMWTFEPSAAKKVFQKWIDKYKIPVVYGERIVRRGEGHTVDLNGWLVASAGSVSDGVVKEGSRIIEIVMESGNHYKGRSFIDATYEGDLMAGAGVSFTVGREGNDIYNESLNGVRTTLSIPDSDVPAWHHHQFEPAVNPYVMPQDSNSGILPMIDRKGPGTEGASDHRIQAYCFRMCLTDVPENRVPFTKPEGYDELNYELLFRNYEAGFARLPWINSPMPNRKTDTNNQSAFSTDFIGANYNYPEASYTERAKIILAHRNYQKGVMWTLANHPRIPEKIRNEISRWGFTKDEFIEGNGWQDQLYIREARRMVSDVVMTQNHCQGIFVADESVGMGAYNMDSHHTQRYIDEKGFVKNEGDVQIGLSKPYPISYKSIVPKKAECTNLLVPVCLSASHIAFGSIRMEPVFMVLGQSAAVAACLSIDQNFSVQEVPYSALKTNLLNLKQILQLSEVNKE